RNDEAPFAEVRRGAGIPRSSIAAEISCETDLTIRERTPTPPFCLPALVQEHHRPLVPVARGLPVPEDTGHGCHPPGVNPDFVEDAVPVPLVQHMPCIQCDEA